MPKGVPGLELSPSAFSFIAEIFSPPVYLDLIWAYTPEDEAIKKTTSAHLR
jgi:hypothetical protein